MELKINTLLRDGTYRILKKLGQGSFGITYLAEHTALGKKVAIKEFYMKDINSRSDDGSITGITDGSFSYNYGQKFKREALNLAKLEHPNIVRVTDCFDENSTYYYVMDLVEGENLNDYLKSHTVSENEAIDIIKDVASALTYMHDQHHMLHLDLKPGNIMRRASDGHIFLIDFGLSKHYNSDGQPETSTTIGLGTPGYAPIEQGNQARGGEFRPTIDVYALGATLFKLLTGETPPAPSDLLGDPDLLTQKMNEKGILQPVTTVVMKAMEPVAQKRFPTVRDFRNQLANLDTVPQLPPQVSQQVPYQNEETRIASDYQAPQQPQPPQPYVASRQAVINNNEQQSDNKKNGKAVAGFVLSLLSVGSLLYVDYGFLHPKNIAAGVIIFIILAILGLVFSIIGVRKKPKGLAIAGIVISGLVILLGVIAVISLATEKDSRQEYYNNGYNDGYNNGGYYNNGYNGGYNNGGYYNNGYNDGYNNGDYYNNGYN